MQSEGLQLGRYRLRRLIGRGGAGEVYLAEDLQITRQVALKIVQSEDSDSEDARDAVRLFQREARTIATLNHPNILPLFDFGEAVIDGVTLSYLVTPFCPEGSLATWLRRRNRALDLSLDEVMHIVQQAAKALEYAHDNQIVHRDVKPSNFLVRSQKSTLDRPDLLLADFGIARFTYAATRISKSIRGTPTYMAPEQWSGNSIPATDQYALAVMVYELLTGRPPFSGTPGEVMYHHLLTQPQAPSATNPRISPSIDAVILRALAKQPDARFPSISDFARAFQQAATDPPTLGMISIPPSSPSAGATVSPSWPLAAPAMVSDIPNSDPASIVQSSDFHTMPDISIAEEGALIQTIPGLAPPRIKWRNLLLIGLALAVIITSTVGLFAFRANQVAISTATATATASQGTIQALQATYSTATASADAKATATAQFNATATLTENPYGVTLKTPALNEPLNGKSPSDWDETTGSCTFTAEGYHVTNLAQATRAHVCAARNTSFSDLIFQVQMNIRKGSSGGILFRSAGSIAYYFRISQDGNYDLFACTGAGTSCITILPSSFSSSINGGQNQLNTIAVVARGTRIELYINNERVNGVNDSSTLQGQIGVVADVTSEVVFSNAKVWTL